MAFDRDQEAGTRSSETPSKHLLRTSSLTIESRVFAAIFALTGAPASRITVSAAQTDHRFIRPDDPLPKVFRLVMMLPGPSQAFFFVGIGY